MHDLKYQLKQLCQRNHDGSFNTRSDRQKLLLQMADQLYELGFRNLKATNLKPKHVTALVQYWQAQSLSEGSIKNRMAEIRWWAQKTARQNVVARSNDFYGIARREIIPRHSKARELTPTQLEAISDPYVKMSLKLQAAFGLRSEESIKISPHWADRGTILALKESWTKGGRAREIPITHPEQREVLNEAKALTGEGCLIPAELRYIDQRNKYAYQCRLALIRNPHGHRHRYAQLRYRELTGWDCPAGGGPRLRALSPEKRHLDQLARLQISREMGHYRESITAVYCGR